MKSLRLLRVILPVLLIALVWVSRERPTSGRNSTASLSRDLPQGRVTKLPPVNDSQVSTEFSAWIENYQVSALPASIPAGIALAKERRKVMKFLIQTDPEQALRLAIPGEARENLPVEIANLLEIQISDAGEFERVVSCYTGGLQRPENAPGEERFVIIDDRRFRAFTYGSRTELQTKNRISLFGIAIDDALAFSPDPVRMISGEDELIVEAFGEEKRFANDNELDRYVAMLLTNEQSPGPGDSVPAGGDEDLPVSNSPWTEGNKRILYFRVRFADQDPAYEPISLANAQAEQDEVAEHYRIASYGKLNVTTEFPDVITLPQNKAAYVGQGLGLMMNDARAIAINLGSAEGKDWDYRNYDFYTIVSDGGIGSYAGVAQVGGAKSHLQKGYTSLRTSAHEFGHNLGLSHANYNYTSDLNPRGATPTQGLGRVEYGHRFSVMSAQSGSDFGNPTLPHFTAHEKWRLDWLTDADYTDVTTGAQSGTYRLYQNDDENATGLRALRLPSGGALSKYWLSYRTAWRQPNRSADNDYLLNGIVFDWTGSGGGSSTLLDMTPYSDDGSTTGSDWTRDNDDKWDAPLLIGRTYTDPESKVSVTPVARGGSAPNEYLDVYVHLATGVENALVNETDFCRAIVPVASTATGTAWTAISFNDSAWPHSGALGVGYDNSSEYPPFFSVNVGTDMKSKNESCYIRVPFNLSGTINPANITSLKLSMRYDDGFVAYLNGVKIAEANAPASPVWNSGAPTTHSDSAAVNFIDFSADAALGALVPGANVLAIHGLNNGTGSSDFLIQPKLTAVMNAAPNAGPTVSLTADTLAAGVNQEVTLTASGSDPDGDPLAYSWDFDLGDAFAPEGLNQAVAVRKWSSAGLYAVTVTCSDQKGGISRARVLVNVGNSSSNGAVQGRVLQGGQPVAGARVFRVGSDQQSITLADGSYVLTRLSTTSGSTLGAMLDGEVFQPSIAMPVTPQPILEGVDFLGFSSLIVDSPPQSLTVSPHLATTDTAGTVPLIARVWNNTQAEDLLIPFGDSWQYLDTGVDPGATWMTAGFDASGWTTGPAEFGYGDTQTTEISYGSDPNDKHATSWFRQTFTASNVASISRLKLSVKRDDGIRVYLNGTEIARDNLTTGTVSATTRALNDVGSSDEDTLIHFIVNPALLVEGNNTLAAEIHQEAADNGDLSFDLALSASRNLSEITPIWSVTPSGANVSPAGVFSATSPGTYTVTATSGALSAASTISVITDNVVSITALDRFLWENGTATATIQITRTGSTGSALVVPLSTGGEASEGVDFQAPPASVTIPTGSLSTSFQLAVLDDGDREGREWVFLTPVAGGSFTLGDDAVAAIAIIDDENLRSPLPEAGPADTVSVNTPYQLAGSLAAVDHFIQAGDYWKFDDRGSEPAAGWKGLPYDDSGWKEGLGKFGYGDGNETTTIEFGSSNSKHITTYFRRRFIVDNPGNVTALAAGLLVDDGAVVYLNGQEIQRVNMPAGVIAFSTRASTSVGGTDEETYFDWPLDPSDLVTGENVIVVEVHQSSPTSSDLGFDLTLTGTTSPAPGIFQWVKDSGPGTATFSNAQSLTSTVSFDQPGTYVLSLEIEGVSDEVAITVEEGLSYAQWIAGFPLLDPNPLADPDLDGMNNLLEFASGSDPSVSASQSISALTSDPLDPTDLLFSYRRLREVNLGDASGTTGDGRSVYGINYTVEVSTDLASWQSASEVFTLEEVGLPIDNGNGSESVTLRLTAPTHPGVYRFVRLRVRQE